MAAKKTYIIKKTIQYTDKEKGTVLVKPSEKAQELPADIAKEALQRGLAVEHVAAEEAPDEQE